MSNFKKITEDYLLRPGYENFADYCLFREKGLRKLAFEALDKFMLDIQVTSRQIQQKIANELVELHAVSEIHTLLPYPLKELLVNILQNWCNQKPADPTPYRWVAFLTWNYDYYLEAISVDPDDQFSLYELAKDQLERLDNDIDHLANTHFMKTKEEATNLLKKIDNYICRLQPNNKTRYLKAYYEKLSFILSIWWEYCLLSRASSFTEYCREQGHETVLSHLPIDFYIT